MKKETKILTVGTFDVPHIGHYHLFLQIKQLFPSGILVVGVNRDDFIERFKGKKPVFTYEERVQMISQINLVDEVVENIGNEDSKVLIEQVKPDVVAVGSDWMKKDYCKQMDFTPEWLEQHAIALLYIPRYLDMSTTLIKNRIKGT